jgi:hypothetical protein
MGIRLDCNIPSDKEAAMYRCSRPPSVSIVGWILTIGSTVNFLRATMFLSDDPILQKLFQGYFSTVTAVIFPVLGFICGVNILRGSNWARWLYTGLCISALILDLIVYFGMFQIVIFPTILRGVAILILFLPNSNDFFSSHDQPSS